MVLPHIRTFKGAIEINKIQKAVKKGVLLHIKMANFGPKCMFCPSVGLLSDLDQG